MIVTTFNHTATVTVTDCLDDPRDVGYLDTMHFALGFCVYVQQFEHFWKGLTLQEGDNTTISTCSSLPSSMCTLYHVS
eukprot:6490447-Amphidinium_carterae.6